MRPVRLLITSGGSLVGQNLLQLLEGRRERVELIAADCDPAVPRLFRYDRVQLIPRLEDPAFVPRLVELIETELPDVVLPGRDHDVLALAELREQRPELARRIPLGPAELARTMNDKWLSRDWALARGLPFVDTLLLDEGDPERLERWLGGRRFPLLAKPRHGWGSLGVRLITERAQLERLAARAPADVMVQELLGFPASWRERVAEFEAGLDEGVQLYFDLPEHDQSPAQSVIAPDGSHGRGFTSRSTMRMGRCERSEPCDDVELAAIAERFVEAMAGAGWRGLFNLQLKRNDAGRFVPHEMNGRISGSTSARRYFGYDEARLIVSAFAGVDIGEDPTLRPMRSGFVARALFDEPADGEAIERLSRTGRWSRS